jgi:glycosyltransferase involved in cell wall biosynthesis
MRPTTEERPLISFVLLAYNQEKYISEAIEAAFSQTYSPLEIILSDDCSTDSTFAFMEEAAEAYTGPNKVVLNRNPVNLGIGGHVNRIAELAQGELIVAAAGDDVSLPSRVEKTFGAWFSDPSAYSLYFDVEYFGDGSDSSVEFSPRLDLHDIQRMIPHAGPDIVGASHAWHRSLFDLFGPIPEDVQFEDRVLPFRAALVGHIRYVNEKVVRYRQHPSQFTVESSTRNELTKAMSYRAYRKYRVKRLVLHLASLRSFLRDIETAKRNGMLSDRQAKVLTGAVQQTMNERALQIAALAGPYLQSVAAAARLVASGSSRAGASWYERARFLIVSAFPVWESWRLRCAGKIGVTDVGGSL